MQPHRGSWNFFPDAAGRALVSHPAACAVVALGMALLNAAARRQGQGCSSPTRSLARAGIGGERLAARNNDAKSEELPKSSFEIHPQLGRRNGDGDGDGGGAKEKPPPYRRLALQPRYPSATRAVPRGLVLPQPLRHVPAVPGVRPSVRQLNQSKHRQRQLRPRKCPWGRSQPGSPRTPGCWAPGDTAGPAEPPTPRPVWVQRPGGAPRLRLSSLACPDPPPPPHSPKNPKTGAALPRQSAELSTGSRGPRGHPMGTPGPAPQPHRGPPAPLWVPWGCHPPPWVCPGTPALSAPLPRGHATQGPPHAK